MVGAKSLNLSLFIILVCSGLEVHATSPVVGGAIDLNVLVSEADGFATVEGDWLVHVERFVTDDDEDYSRPDLIVRNPTSIAGYEFAKGQRVSRHGHVTLSLELRLPKATPSEQWVMQLPRSYSACLLYTSPSPRD